MGVTDTTAAASPTGECILGVTGNLTRVTGVLNARQNTYSLILTDRRIIFAEANRERLSALAGQAADSAKRAGKGFVARMRARIRVSSVYHETYRSMAPDEILADSSGNFALDRTAVKKVEFKSGIANEWYSSSDQVIIKTASGEYRLQVHGSVSKVEETFRGAGMA